jgi:hypothetical protein
MGKKIFKIALGVFLLLSVVQLVYFLLNPGLFHQPIKQDKFLTFLAFTYFCSFQLMIRTIDLDKLFRIKA